MPPLMATALISRFDIFLAEVPLISVVGASNELTPPHLMTSPSEVTPIP